MQNIPPLDDATFLQQFERQTLSPEHFNHIGHLRLAWLYLSQYPLDEAERRVYSGIQAYASSLGATDKFHHTITCALVNIMANRMQNTPQIDWQSFIDQQPDLRSDAVAVLLNYYQQDSLGTSAKRTFRQITASCAPRNFCLTIYYVKS